MSNIRIDLPTPVSNGQSVTFRSPADCSEVTGLIVYHPVSDGTLSTEFKFADAHGNNVGAKDLFAEDVLVKVVLDTELRRAYVQNADTNSYLEGKFAHLGIESDEYQGCFYRVVNGVTKWINPPMIPGVEYCTTEYDANKPVYVKNVSTDMPEVGESIDILISSTEGDQDISLIEFDGYMVNRRDSDVGSHYWYKFPVISRVDGKVLAIAVFYSNKATESDSFNWLLRVTNLSSNITGQDCSAMFTVKYTKRVR